MKKVLATFLITIFLLCGCNTVDTADEEDNERLWSEYTELLSSLTIEEEEISEDGSYQSYIYNDGSSMTMQYGEYGYVIALAMSDGTVIQIEVPEDNEYLYTETFNLTDGTTYQFTYSYNGDTEDYEFVSGTKTTK